MFIVVLNNFYVNIIHEILITQFIFEKKLIFLLILSFDLVIYLWAESNIYDALKMHFWKME